MTLVNTTRWTDKSFVARVLIRFPARWSFPFGHTPRGGDAYSGGHHNVTRVWHMMELRQQLQIDAVSGVLTHMPDVRLWRKIPSLYKIYLCLRKYTTRTPRCALNLATSVLRGQNSNETTLARVVITINRLVQHATFMHPVIMVMTIEGD